jgi:peroxiredoxin
MIRFNKSAVAATFILALFALPASSWADAEAPAPVAAPVPAPASPAPAPAPPAAPEIRAGHSIHGEAFDEGPRQAAYLMGGTGKVRFPVTTKNPDAQRFFEQGVGQLHGFWYFEAERSFRQAAALDRDCAMAYWGMAMANVYNDGRARKLIKEAVGRKQHASPREAMWIDGLDEYYNGAEQDEAKRRRQHIRKLEAIVHAFPDDVEAKAFLAWRIWDSQQKLPIPSVQAVDALVDQVLLVEPMHPAHHYRIHLWDDDKPERALGSAARAGQAAPAIAHMWHMPGHTYTKLRRYEDAAFQQEASARVDHARMVRDRTMPYQIHNYAHNNAWCVESLLFVGRVGEAIDLAKNLIELPRHPKHNTPGYDRSAAGGGREALVDVLATHEMWDDYLALAGGPYLDGSGGESPDQRVHRLRYLGVAHAAKGNKDKAAEQIAALEALQRQADAVVAANAPKEGDDAATVAAKAKGKDESDQAGKRSGRAAKAVAHVRGQLALAAGDVPGALTLFEQADLRKDHLSQAYLAAGNGDRAEQLAREAVDAAPNQCYPLANQVDVLSRRGKTAEAGEAFARLRNLSARIDLAAPAYARLAPVAQSLGFPADWRLAKPPPADVLPRPDLDALGPFRWHPVAAPEWSLPAADGRTIALPDYRGRPVLVVFYLGYGCLHCVEQLNAFAPLAAEFEQAGISIVAVSTDSLPGLAQSLASAKSMAPGTGAAGYPFPLVSDESMATFKAYRAFDEFEGKPLHGTFLVDAAGLVRWQDVSPEPFTDVRFLLEESKRLLLQPSPAAG